MSKKKILIVDDSGLVRLVVSDELSKLGYDTYIASNADKALKSCKSKKPDLILLDVMLPGTNGFELCKKIKGDPDIKDVPIVFMTAKDQPQDLLEGKRAGGCAYLIKPFEGDELQRTVSKFIGKGDVW
ncbi:MAG: response regulator [Candidatus Aureabacteria bacterium]|nr:response regulator [Candidatus Auribacterota bacterium]